MILTDETGKILDVLNSTHPDPGTLINKYAQNLIIDGFVQKFHKILDQVMTGSGPKNFMCLINFTGAMEARWCRVIKISKGFMIIAERFAYITDFEDF